MPIFCRYTRVFCKKFTNAPWRFSKGTRASKNENYCCLRFQFSEVVGQIMWCNSLGLLFRKTIFGWSWNLCKAICIDTLLGAIIVPGILGIPSLFIPRLWILPNLKLCLSIQHVSIFAGMFKKTNLDGSYEQIQSCALCFQPIKKAINFQCRFSQRLTHKRFEFLKEPQKLLIYFDIVIMKNVSQKNRLDDVKWYQGLYFCYHWICIPISDFPYHRLACWDKISVVFRLSIAYFFLYD